MIKARKDVTSINEVAKVGINLRVFRCLLNQHKFRNRSEEAVVRAILSEGDFHFANFSIVARVGLDDSCQWPVVPGTFLLPQEYHVSLGDVGLDLVPLLSKLKALKLLLLPSCPKLVS